MRTPSITLFGLLLLTASPGVQGATTGLGQSTQVRVAVEGVGLQSMDQPGAWFGGGPDYRVAQRQALCRRPNAAPKYSCSPFRSYPRPGSPPSALRGRHNFPPRRS